MFLYDTGSPHTYLRRETWAALGFGPGIDIPSRTNVTVQGVIVPVSMSRGHFANVDLLGQNYCEKAGLRIEMDYRRRTLHMST
jgi:hypothetical protein